MELSQLKQIIAEQFRHQKGIAAVLLYGSYAKGVAKPGSDVDIAVLFHADFIPNDLELWELGPQISLALGKEVDLICLNTADPIIGHQIYQYHDIVLLNNSTELTQYWGRLSSEYAELKEFIRPMEDQILQRKYYDRP